ncbi:endopeptidase [Stenotrophomonas geniculata]
MNRVLLALLLGLSVLVIWQRGSVAQAHRAADIASAARDKARDERDAAAGALANANGVLASERASAQAANRLAATYEKEKHDAQKASYRLIADLRAGNQRLHQRWQATVATAELSAAAAAASQPDGRADDRIESAGRAIGAAAECDTQVRGLQAFARLCSATGVP